jgi:hypothetical protein
MAAKLAPDDTEHRLFPVASGEVRLSLGPCEASRFAHRHNLASLLLQGRDSGKAVNALPGHHITRHPDTSLTRTGCVG